MSQGELPYSIPKNVPKWVMGFPEYLENSLHVGGTEPSTLRQTWKNLESQYWSDFQACGKKRTKKNKNGGDSDDASSDKAKEKLGKSGPKLSKRVREHLKQLERIAQEMGSPEMANTVAQLRNDLEQ